MANSIAIGLILTMLLAATTMPSDFDKLWDYNNPIVTEQQFRALLPDADKSNDRAYEAELLTQIARTQGMQGKFDDAHATLDRAEKVIDTPTMPKARVRYLLERGRAFNSSDHPDTARPLFVEAMEIAQENHLDGYAIDAVHMIAIVAPTPDEQLKWNYRGVELAEKSSDPAARRWLASLYNNIGCTLDDQKRYDEALKIFQKALELRETMGQKSQVLIARYTIARTLRRLNRIDEALAEALAIHKDATAAGDPDPYVCEEIGEDLLIKGQPSDAAPYFKIAYEGLAKDVWLKNHEPERLERLAEHSKAK
jgi:tetratricopeptide (TPR) repeat protein